MTKIPHHAFIYTMVAAPLILGEGPKNFRPKQLGGGGGRLEQKIKFGGGGELNFRGGGL